ncbi:sigma-70 family RNA polymerase sigma factor [Acetobacteraceae bacterium KSS8]|uniref:Sigma-70 family RNA polymerase sigma factor n=1 Tax=Endosaccharibacter trunci TaxID=2812733 RepID=A0ABT1W531_9PROT|nr:sigma-70 family RNA polymerase sigma factor [Acetobacteraceae bacterium KSS8]
MAGEDVAALLDRCAGGDQSAFKRLYDAQSPRLYALALRLLKQPVLAADAVHDTFMHVWRMHASERAERFDPAHGPAEAWLAALLRARAIDTLRRGGRQPLEQPDGAASAEEGDEVLEKAPDREVPAPDGRFAALDPSAFHALRLAYLEGLTYGELADRLQQPLGTVKAGVRRALIGLKACARA